LTCLNPLINYRVGNGSITLDRPDDIYWDFQSPDQRSDMVFASTTKAALALRMAGIRQVLSDSDKFKKDAGFYDPGRIDRACTTALASPVFTGLLFTESQTIRHARDAGLRIAKFRANAGTDPQDFGAKITDAFNHGLHGLIPRLEEFSAMIFLEAARAFDPGLVDIQPTARLDVILLKPSAPATAADDFLTGTAPDATAVAIEQPVVGLP
jgi:hypothetical protein